MEDVKKLSDYVSEHWGKPSFDREKAHQLFLKAYSSKENQKALWEIVNFQYYVAVFLFSYKDTIFKWMKKKPVFKHKDFKEAAEALVKADTSKSNLDISSAFVWASVLNISMSNIYHNKDGTINKTRIKNHMNQLVDMGLNFCLDKFLKKEAELIKKTNTVH